MTINATIKLALENTVLCRGANTAKESYAYAENMEELIKHSIRETLVHALENTDTLENCIKEIIKDLER
jgi:hypothetical protein